MDPARPKPAKPNFAYPNYKQQKPTFEYAQPSQYQQYQQSQGFPPHPGVRPSSSGKLSARQVPAGVGVAPPPVRLDGKQRSQQSSPATGILVQDFKFPTAPPSSRPGKVNPEHSQPARRQYNMNESYMSPVAEDYPSSGTTPGTTPSSKFQRNPMSRAYSGSVYAESGVLGIEEPRDHTPQGSRPGTPDESPQIVRQASLGKRAKPAMTTIKNRASHVEQDLPENAPAPVSTGRNETMNALSAAVAAGITRPPLGDRTGTPGSRSYTPVRMPFDTSPPASPSADREFLQTPKSPRTIASTNMLEQTPGSGHSRQSTNPLLGLGIEQPSMSDKIPPTRRPPKLDMGAVKEAENRGSTTSLSDLIKRATRLAANLDRGRTASRLGMLDMFGSSEKLDGKNRHSTMSDMISAFPAPAAGGTPTHRKDSEWPLGEKGGAYASTTDLSKEPPPKQGRRCCGMTMPVFFSLIVTVIILIAAAVLIPIFLILVPKQHKDGNVTGCASSHPCGNGGTRITSGSTCACICANGFIGSQCETAGNTDDCLRRTLKDGTTEYKNATIGSSVLPSLTDGQDQFKISLNVSTILSVFSTNNLSCASENSLVDFNSSSINQSGKARRFVMLPGMETPAVMDGNAPGADTPWLAQASGVQPERRQNEATTSNGIVFQATSASASSASSPTASADTGVVTSLTGGLISASSSPTASGATPASTSAVGNGSSDDDGSISDKEVDFAKVVVLYVLQESRTISVAINAQQQMESFFASKTAGNSNSTVDVGTGNLHLTADFNKFCLISGDGQVVKSKDD
ncbi:hypothetical protein ABEF91_003996 [Exophiala dermatitidis]